MGSKGHVYVERRDNGKYAVMVGGAKRASGLFDTQAKAIAAAKRMHPDVKPDVERQRTRKSGSPDHWRG